MKRSIVVLMAIAAVAGTAMADIIHVEAESASPLGSNFVVSADAAALGGSYITETLTRFGEPVDLPTEVRATYSLGNVDAGTTWDVYARLRVGPGGLDDDSMFVASVFGTDVANTDMVKINGITFSGGLEGGAHNGAFAWVQYDAGLGLLAPINAGAGGAMQWEITSREDGLDLDAFAFVTAGQEVTVGGDNMLVAIPEPATIGLVGIAGAIALFVRRRLTM